MYNISRHVCKSPVPFRAVEEEQSVLCLNRNNSRELPGSLCANVLASISVCAWVCVSVSSVFAFCFFIVQV